MRGVAAASLAAVLVTSLLEVAAVEAQTATTTTITSDTPDPSPSGQSVTVNFTVTATSGTPAGPVTVTDGVDSCTASVAAGTCNITLTTPGTRTLTATYPGGGGFDPSSDTEPHGVMVVITVNTSTDEPFPTGQCSLRKAIRAANTNTAVDTCPAGSSSLPDAIVLPAGTYTLTFPGSDDTAIAGDLDITGDTRITGAGATTTVIQGSSERVLHIVGGTVRIDSLTITGGRHAMGGGIRNDAALTMTNTIVKNNTARTGGGGASLGGGISP